MSKELVLSGSSAELQSPKALKVRERDDDTANGSNPRVCCGLVARVALAVEAPPQSLQLFEPYLTSHKLTSLTSL